MTEGYLDIEGSNGLARHMDSHAVINKDKNALKQTLAMREKRKQDAQDIQNLKRDMADLKNTMGKILKILEDK